MTFFCEPTSRGPREVLGIDGNIAIVGPDDVLVVRISRALTPAEASLVSRQVRDVLGKNRCLIFDEMAELFVIRGGTS